MANVTPSIVPGSFADPQSMTLALSANVDYINYTLNGAAPVISKYIAYDTLTPPGPFIAVTQDGTGNVVYDGGFPKFYNANAPTAGIDSSTTMEFSATNDGSSTTGNAYYYNAFTLKNVTIAAGDKLVYDMWQNTNNTQTGIDAITAANPNTDPAVYSIRDWGYPATNKIVDQNGYPAHPATDLQGRATNQWYHREIDLSQCAGATFVRWSMAFEGETPGDFYARYRNVYILAANGTIKATLFKDVIDLPNSSSSELGASGYTKMTKTLYDPRGQLTASFKYLYNALYWCTSEANYIKSNKTVLILGDTPSTSNYAVKSTTDSGFNISFTRLCAAAGYTPTFKDVSDYTGGLINEPLATLNNYACVLLMSSALGGTPLITDACVQDLQTYRAGGGGVIVITDDGPDYTDITQAYPAAVVNRMFFCTANKLIVNFGAYFTGNYDRTPVNVGFLRTNYGDHPLYGGMADSESIQAGGSESKVVVATFTKYTSANLGTFTIPKGRTTIKILAMLKDGTIEQYSLIYSVASGELLAVFGADGNALSAIDVGWGNVTVLSALVKGSGLGTLTGDILVNTTKIATLSYSDANGSVTTWVGFAGAGFKVNNGDVVKVRLTSPFSYSKSFNVTRKQPDLSKVTHLQGLMSQLQGLGLPSVLEAEGVAAVIAAVNKANGGSTLKLSSQTPTNIQNLKDYFKVS